MKSYYGQVLTEYHDIKKLFSNGLSIISFIFEDIV